MKQQTLHINDLFHLASVSTPTPHPKKPLIVYVKTMLCETKNQYESHLFCYDISSQQTTQWTFGESQNFAPIWSNDGQTLLFISTRSGKSQAYSLSLLGGEAKQLTSVLNGINKVLWHPDNNSIIYSAFVPDDLTNSDEKTEESDIQPRIVDKMVYRRDSIGFFDLHSHDQLFKLDLSLASADPLQLTFELVNHTLHDISPDGNYLIYSCLLDFNNEKAFDTGVFELNLIHHTSVLLTHSIASGHFSYAIYSPNQQYVALIGHDEVVHAANIPTLFIHNRTTHTCERILHEELYVGDCAVGDFKQKATSAPIAWTKDSTSLYVQISTTGKVGIYHITLAGTLQPFLVDHEHVFGFALLETSDKLVAAISTPTVPNEIYIINTHDKTRTQITAYNMPFLSQVILSEYIELSYKAADGGKIHGYLVKPHNLQQEQQYPLIYNIHGGPHAMHTATFFHEAQIMAAKGYAVLLFNPRGSHGYGKNHVEGVLGNYGDLDYQDLMQGLDNTLKDYPWINPQSLFVTGGSYGGYMTNWIVTQTNRFRSAVTQRSISNWVSMTGTSDIGFFFDAWEMKTDIFDIDELWRRSPLAHVRNIETPLLILHGEEDYRCPIEQAEQFYTYLKYLEQPTQFIRFPKSSHELSRSGIPSLRIARLSAIMNWFEKYQ